MTEISNEELEARMRRKLMLDGPIRHDPQFTPEQQAIADKLIGRHNVERLQHHRPDGRRFRPTPVFVHYEYWWVNGGEFMSYWNMARIENGRRSDHNYTGDVATEINRLKAAGFTVKEIKIEGAPSLVGASKSGLTPRTGRKSFTERFGNFGGRRS